jgi:hypothetical protein
MTMKNKTSNRRGWSYFFRQRIHGRDTPGSMLELVKPESEWGRTASVLEGILRWADDGGQNLVCLKHSPTAG